MNDAAQFEAQLGSTIAQAVSEGLVNRWVCLVEVIEDDGTRILLTAGSEDLRAWDTLGMLDYALERERANVAIDYADGEADDD